MSNNNQNAPKYNFCSSQLKTSTEKFIWTIDNFSKRQNRNGEYMLSTEFTATAPNGQLLKWRMQLYPNGNEEESKDCVSLYLLYIINPNIEEVQAKYQISILALNGEEVELVSVQKEFLKFNRDDQWGNDLIKREDLFKEENGYLDGDRLTIVCNLIVQQELVEKAPLPDVKVPECRALEDMSHLYEKSLFTDCKIISEDDQEYKVHKCILGCRSPVFGAMFEHEMTEKNSNEINIVDIKGDVIDKMLRFIYSGKEPDLEEINMAEDLLIAADKYGLTRLKLICERKLINSMGSGNVCGLLLLATQYPAEHIKAHAINFIKAHMNEVKETEGWEAILVDKKLVELILMA